MATAYDAIVIGGGHNGLVTACYLAKAKWKVLVLERRHLVGGACVTEEDVFPGFKVSTAAYVNSLFRPEIIRDLKLREFGFDYIERNPSLFTPFADGRYLMLGPDAALNRSEIAKFSTRDAERYPAYEKMLERVAAVVEPTLDADAAERDQTVAAGPREIGKARHVVRQTRPGDGRGARDSDRRRTPDPRSLVRIRTAQRHARHRRDHRRVRRPVDAGYGLVLFHHVMGETNGHRGVWSYVRGGMGGLTNRWPRPHKRSASRSAPKRKSRASSLRRRRVGRRARERRGIRREGRSEQRRLPADLRDLSRSGDAAARIRRANWAVSTIRARRRRSTLRSTRCPTSARVRATLRGRNTAARSTSAPIRTSSRRPTTKPNTDAFRASPWWNAPFHHRSIPRSHQRANT